MKIYGISYDSPEDNRAWAEAMGFDFPLLSDPDHEVSKLLQVQRPPDDKYHGLAPQRVTYLIDPDRVIRRAYLVGRDEISTHAQSVLNDVRGLL